MRTTVTAAIRSLVVVLGLSFFCAAGAQSPAVSPQEADQAKEQATRQVTQPLNNAPVWKEIRSGEKQYTSIVGRETNVLIQPQGQTWRAARVPLATVGGFLFAAALVVLGAFYLWRGPITVRGAPSGRLIERFTLVERTVHWIVAITFTTLAVTGLILTFGKTALLPLIGYTLFSWLAVLAKNLHNFVGPILIIGVPWLFLRFIRDNGVGADDVRWFTNIAGYFKGHEHPSRRFNAGEKVVFWLVLVVASTTLIVSGLIMLFPNFDQTRSTMQITNVVHVVAAYLSIALACVHIYLGTIGMQGAYRAMRDGYVDESWAEHHHLLWYKEAASGKSRQKFVVPGRTEAQPAAPRTRPA